MEEWRDIPGYEGIYQASSLGRVRTVKTGHIKKPTQHVKDRRLFLLLWKENKYRLFKVHRLVLLAFRGHPPHKHEGCHNDGNVENNRLDNLRWDTASANQRDRAKHGTSNRGERCAAAKLTESDVRAIRKDGRLQRLIAADYGVRDNTVSRIKAGKSWAHVEFD